MEERTSSFIELKITEMSPKSAKSRASRASKHSHASSHPRGSGATRQSNIQPYTDKDANAMILRANAPPNYDGGFDEIMKQIKAKKYYTEQFQRIQQQTEMGRSLCFSDIAPTYYESSYLQVAQETSVTRVRICFGIGLVALTIFYINEWRQDKWEPSETVGRTSGDELAIKILVFGVMMPAFAIGLLSTLTSFGRRHLENVTMIVFIIVAAVMIAKKPIEKATGAVIPLLILLIPICGITRMRFVKSCCIGWGIVLSYLLVMVIMKSYVPKPDQFDTYSDISYAAINYGISMIGGMVSQYRQELLRRRNFCLQLPFSGTMDSDAVEDIKADKFSKKTLMHRWSLKFRHPEVEECFYRYWYLIDPFPYENPNSGSLHTGVFRTIRFAIITLLLNQFVLLLQDIKFLVVKKDKLVDDHDIRYALVLRFGVTVPLYLSAALFMYFVGKMFYEKWVQEAEEAKNAALMRDKSISVTVDSNENNKTVTEIVQDRSSTASEDPKLKLIVEAEIVKSKTKDRVMDVLISHGGYVRSTQIFSSLVIASHVCCMGILLLIVSTGKAADLYEEETGKKPGKPKSVYYMGFLNAVLFAHRSGFRVRFVYATYTTFVVATGIVIAAGWLSPDYYLEYLGYVAVIFLMGMMISHEEESLRRTFFVLKSIRTLEFDEWFSVVLRIQGWVREHFRKRLREVRSKGSKDLKDDINAANKGVPTLVNTSAQMAQASKFGMYSQMFNIGIALIDVLTSSL